VIATQFHMAVLPVVCFLAKGGVGKKNGEDAMIKTKDNMTSR
jgi:hypothetical protein